MRLLVLLSLCACATLENPGEQIFVFDPAQHEPTLVQYAYSSGHFELVYEVYVYQDRTVCYFRSHDPRRLTPRFVANGAELASMCSPAPDRCAYPGELGARMAVLEALANRADPNGPVELHLYTHPDEAGSLDEAVALAQARALTLLPLFDLEGVTPEQIDVFAHGWIGSAQRVLHSDVELDPCDIGLWDFATPEESAGREAFDFTGAEPDPVLADQLRLRCRSAIERCRGANCVDSFDGLGWAEILGDSSSRQRSELAVTEPFDRAMLADIRSRVASLGPPSAGDSPHFGFHIPSVSFALGSHDVAYRAGSLPAAAHQLDAFFTRGVARGCRFDASVAETPAVEDPRDVDFTPLR